VVGLKPGSNCNC